MKTKIPSRFTLGKLLAVAAACLAMQSAQAQIFQEGFNYTAGGGLGGNVNSGSGAAWTGNNNITVDGTDPLLTYSGLNNISVNNLKVVWGVTSGSAVNTPAFTSVTGGQIYYSFLLDITTLPSASSYLTAMNKAGTSPGGSGDAIDIYVNATGALQMRTGGTYSTATSALSLNTTYLVVLEYDFGATLGSLYLNPSSASFGSSSPVATETATPGTAPTAIGDVGFKAQTSSSTGDFLIDNLQIGTTWASVTQPVPEPSTLALTGAGLLGLVARFRRARG